MVNLDRRFICQLTFSCCNFCALSLAIFIAIMCFNIRDNDIGEEILIDGAQLIGLDWEK